MQVLIVFCHPEPHSFNAALKTTAVAHLESQGHAVEVSDLYAEGFDPVEGPGHFPRRADPAAFSALSEQRRAHAAGELPAEVTREIARLERADLIILQFPLWWHAQPAMLKGWFDRVMVYGGLYSGSRRYDRGRLRGKRAFCSVTTGSPEAAFTRQGRGGEMASLLWPIHRSLAYLGLAVLPPFVIYGVQGGGLQYEQETLFRERLEGEKHAWRDRLDRLESLSPIPFAGWDDWDEQGVLRPEHPLAWRP